MKVSSWLLAPLLASVVLSAAGAGWARPLDATRLATLDRLSDPQVSPDGRTVLYDLRTVDLHANAAHHALWAVAIEGGPPRRLPTPPGEASQGRWSPDGRAVYYLSDRAGVQQVWRLDLASGAAVPATNLPLDVEAFRLAPDGRHAVVAMAVFPDAEAPAATKARQEAARESKASGKLFDKLFVRHWDAWADGTRNHLFSLALDGRGLAAGEPTPLMAGFDGDVPGKPFGDDADFAISLDGASVVFSARPAGRSEPWSTNFDLYQTPIDGSAAPRDLTTDNLAWDAEPVFSPDGRELAYRAQKRPGFEADRFGVMVMNLATGARREIDPAWDRSADQIAWSRDGRAILVTAEDTGQKPLFRIDAASGQVTRLTQDGSIGSIVATPGGVVFTRTALDSPARLYRLADVGGGAASVIADVNAAQLASVGFSRFEPFRFPGWNGETVHGYVVEPYDRQAGRRYPVVYLIHGGPQGSFGDDWSYRWNPQVWAGWGYGVVMVDFHGSTGYGQAFTDAISQHWGDRPLEDLQKGWAAALAKFPYLDGGRACAAGASYGGYMIYWIAGVWNAPWKCLIDHDGVFDNRMMGYATEELWFSEWENGGTPWANPAGYARFNPEAHVADWSKPMLVIHSAKDFRIPLEQGLAAFTALQRRGIPSEFLTFPDENHWVLKPANSVQWHGVVHDWLRRWLGS